MIKFIIAIVTIVVILMSIFVILKVNLEDNTGNFNSVKQKFLGTWKLINMGENNDTVQSPDTTEEPDKYINNETYEFLSNGTYYHIVDIENSSGNWEINNSILVLTTNDPFGVLSLSYEYYFYDDNNKLTLTFFGDPENIVELERIAII